jgi:hypothetical protein
MKRLVLLSAALAVVAIAGPAHADPYSCTIRGYLADPVGCLPHHAAR